ncbi:MAG: pyridoxamine 5'-phosphate oxidase family protein [Lachnospiraceae bacterium]|nr:pyridoxamine 5'-phosphate oxidase family protein [Lachnospiraceae bacterium]
MTRRETEITDKTAIESILDTCKYLHLGASIDDMPYVVTLNYGYEWDKSDGHLVLYLHTAKKAHLLSIIDKNQNCAFSMECNVEPFFGPIPCRNGMVYESIMGSGKISVLGTTEEKAYGLRRIMKTQTGSDEGAFDERLVSIVGVMRVDVKEMKAKKRELPEALR